LTPSTPCLIKKVLKARRNLNLRPIRLKPLLLGQCLQLQRRKRSFQQVTPYPIKQWRREAQLSKQKKRVSKPRMTRRTLSMSKLLTRLNQRLEKPR